MFSYYFQIHFYDNLKRYFLQLIDCGEEHYPCVSICLTDRESSSPLPYERINGSPELRANIQKDQNKTKPNKLKKNKKTKKKKQTTKTKQNKTKQKKKKTNPSPTQNNV
jgi:hypothetical protein